MCCARTHTVLLSFHLLPPPPMDVKPQAAHQRSGATQVVPRVKICAELQQHFARLHTVPDARDVQCRLSYLQQPSAITRGRGVQHLSAARAAEGHRGNGRASPEPRAGIPPTRELDGVATRVQCDVCNILRSTAQVMSTSCLSLVSPRSQTGCVRLTSWVLRRVSCVRVAWACPTWLPKLAESSCVVISRRISSARLSFASPSTILCS
jgi:hypothetical protein